MALTLHEQAGNTEGVGAAQRWLSRLSWFLGRGEDATRYGLLALETLEALPPGHELAMAYSNSAQLHMLAGDKAGTVPLAQRAVELARALDDVEVETHALNNWGTAMALDGEAVEGLARLRHSLDLALAADLHEHAARAYTNLGSILVELRRLTEADRELAAGIAYCTERDLDSWRLYMSSWLAGSYLAQGRLTEAGRIAHRVLQEKDVAPVSRIPALVVAGTVAVRTEDPAATTLLDEARDLAVGTGEAQRIVPAAAAVWESQSCGWWRAVCLGLSPDLDDARAGAEQLASMGASGTRRAVLRVRHGAGLPVPRGPRQRTKDNPAGLTPRELEVLALLAEGLTNAQLGARLFVSAKTVDHHVSSVLRKLGEATRSGAVAAALNRGLVPNMGSTPDVPSTP